ncbi:hypothetical protein BT69DRAFT_1346781 [Atractiella rhizophila]|nr:hypothetical protein BT69DRAFT_1346781 [Atractiella rhizophila]
MCVVNEGYLEGWSMEKERRESMVMGHPLKKPVAEFSMRNVGVPEQESLAAQVIDVSFSSSKPLVFLVKYHHPSVAPNLLSYLLLLASPTLNSFTPLTLTCTLLLSHTSTPLVSRPPKLYKSGPSAFILFSSAVTFLSLSLGVDYEEVVLLKKTPRGILGCGQGVKTTSEGWGVTVVTGKSGVLEISKRAVYFGEREENPLDFGVSGRWTDEVESHAMAISKEVLMNTSSRLSKALDMRIQLADRIQKLENLIKLLCTNEEKLIAAKALWEMQNARLLSNESETTVFDEAGYIYLSRSSAVQEDAVRPFFRAHVGEIGSVLERIPEVLGMRTADGMEEKSLTVHEANFVISTAYDAVFESRSRLYKTYGIETSHSFLKPWTSSGSLIDVIKHLFETTDTALLSHQREFGASSIDDDVFMGDLSFGEIKEDPRRFQRHLRTQMRALADTYCALCEERLVYLRTLETAEAPIMAKALSDRYITTRPIMLKALIRLSSYDDALELAQKYRDYRILVELCTHPTYGGKRRIEEMIARFAEKFAFQLYQYYIEKGEVRNLLEQDQEYNQILLKFLESTDNPKLAWIHEILLSRHAHAYNELVREACQEKNVDEHKSMLSIAKLCRIAELSTPDFNIKEIQLVDQLLDVMKSHERIRELIQRVADQQDAATRNRPERLKLAVLEILDARLTNYFGYPSLFNHIITEIMQHHTVSGEDIIDAFTLMESPDLDDPDFCHALGILDKIQADLPTARAEFALKTIWRRLYIAGNVTISDDQVETVLRTTPLALTLVQIQEIGANPECPQQGKERTTAARPNKKPKLGPRECLFDVETERKALEARFVHLPKEMVNALLEDYERESQILEEELDSGLENFVDEIIRLQS